MTRPTDTLRLVPLEPTEAMIFAGALAAMEAATEFMDDDFWKERHLSAIERMKSGDYGSDEERAKAIKIGSTLFRAMLSAAPASPLPEGGGWQDLSGAPRDGTEFQAWWKGTWQPRARFDPEYGSFQLWGRTDFDTEGWEVFEIDGFWQPQPAAPTGAK